MLFKVCFWVWVVGGLLAHTAYSQVDFDLDAFPTLLSWNSTVASHLRNATHLQFRIDAPTNDTSLQVNSMGVLQMTGVRWDNSHQQWMVAPLPLDTGNVLGSGDTTYMADLLNALQSNGMYRYLDTRPPVPGLQEACPTMTMWRLDVQANVFVSGKARNASSSRQLSDPLDLLLTYIAPVASPDLCPLPTATSQQKALAKSALWGHLLVRALPWTALIMSPDSRIFKLSNNHTVFAYAAFVQTQTIADTDTLRLPFPWRLIATRLDHCSVSTSGEPDGRIRAELIFAAPSPSIDIVSVSGVTLLCEGNRECRMVSTDCLDPEEALVPMRSEASTIVLSARISDLRGRRLYAYVALATERLQDDSAIIDINISHVVMEFMGSVSMPLFLIVLSAIFVLLLALRYSCEYGCKQYRKMQRRRQRLQRVQGAAAL